MKAGQKAALPSPGWRPKSRRDGARLLFVSEDGRQRKWFDFSDFPVTGPVLEELLDAFERASGPSGAIKRQATMVNAIRTAKTLATWCSAAHPDLTTLADLGAADGTLAARAFTNPRERTNVGTVINHCSAFTPEFEDAFRAVRESRNDTPIQPLADADFTRVGVMARSIIRAARDRIWEGRQIVAEHRLGLFDHLDSRHPTREFAAVLDYVAREHDVPRSGERRSQTKAVGRANRTMAARYSPLSFGGTHSPLHMLHLTARECWAFAVLLTAQTGVNRIVLEELEAPHLAASGPDEPGIALVDTYKPRRGSRAHGVLPLTAYPPELASLAGGPVSPLPNTSLNAPFGVFSLLLDLTEPARQALGQKNAFVFAAPSLHGPKRVFRTAVPGGDQRVRGWAEPWLGGTDDNDDGSEEVVRPTFARLRKTRIRQAKRPIGHTRDTNHQYLMGMRAVIEDGFAIVREAQEQEVGKALARRQMQVSVTPSGTNDPGAANDTVLGTCSDFEHSPLDHNEACRRTFMSCLDCLNARAFPRHLPNQLAVADRLRELRQLMGVEDWTARHAGQLAQLDDIASVFTTAQVAHARTQITAAHRDKAARLFRGDFDPQ